MEKEIGVPANLEGQTQFRVDLIAHENHLLDLWDKMRVGQLEEGDLKEAYEQFGRIVESSRDIVSDDAVSLSDEKMARNRR